jgi:hypothetical protein
MASAFVSIVKSRTMAEESAIGEFDLLFSIIPTCPGFSFLRFFFLAAKPFKDIFTFGIDRIGGGGGDTDSTLLETRFVGSVIV